MGHLTGAGGQLPHSIYKSWLDRNGEMMMELMMVGLRGRTEREGVREKDRTTTEHEATSDLFDYVMPALRYGPESKLDRPRTTSTKALLSGPWSMSFDNV
jgi:hypothetical protein